MVFIGDLYQLPPVVTGEEREIFRSRYRSPWFFDAAVMAGLDMEFIELEKVYRQRDASFISILNAIRNNSVTDEDLKAVNRRYDPGFTGEADDLHVLLTTRNAAAEAVNVERLSSLRSGPRVYRGNMTGDFTAESLPTQLDLQVKVGAQVMLLNNDTAGRWVNGTVGKIAGIGTGENADVIAVRTSEGDTVEVGPYTWEIFRYTFDKKRNRIDAETVGSFTQYPLRLAWAVTIHKSQGKTFDRVVIDIGRGTFATGQVYVALSRCTSLDGIVLRKPIEKKHIFMDWRVVRFLTGIQYERSEKKRPVEDKVAMIEEAIRRKARLRIVYLKNTDVKSRRVVTPSTVGWTEYKGKRFLGMQAFCHDRNDSRMFRVDRILEMDFEGGEG